MFNQIVCETETKKNCLVVKIVVNISSFNISTFQVSIANCCEHFKSDVQRACGKVDAEDSPWGKTEYQ